MEIWKRRRCSFASFILFSDRPNEKPRRVKTMSHSLLRSSKNLPPFTSSPLGATQDPRQRPHPLSQPVRAFKEGEQRRLLLR